MQSTARPENLSSLRRFVGRTPCGPQPTPTSACRWYFRWDPRGPPPKKLSDTKAECLAIRMWRRRFRLRTGLHVTSTAEHYPPPTIDTGFPTSKHPNSRLPVEQRALHQKYDQAKLRPRASTSADQQPVQSVVPPIARRIVRDIAARAAAECSLQRPQIEETTLAREKPIRRKVGRV